MEISTYDPIVRWLHWLSAGVILWAIVSGLYMATLEPGSTLRGWISWFNVSLTTAFVPFFVVRMVAAIVAGKPDALAVSRRQRRIARIVHASLYVLTAVVLLSGLLMMQQDIDIFGLVQVPQPVNHRGLNNVSYKVHRYGCMALFILVTGHVAAVIHHHRNGRRVMTRMAPGRRQARKLAELSV